MHQLYSLSLKPRKKIAWREASPSIDKENSSHFSNLVSHRFQDEKRASLKSNKNTTIASIPLVTSVSVTPIHQSPHPESNVDDLFIKMDNYLLMTNVLIEEALVAHTSSDSLIKQIKRLRQSLVIMLENYKSIVKVQNSATKKSLGNQKLLQKIRILQSQNRNLQQKIGKQEQTNLNLILEMNNNQSNGIQYFKQKLQQSYNSYKNLQDKVETYQSQFQQMKNIKELIQQQNQNKTRTIQCLQQKIKRNSLKSKDLLESKFEKDQKQQNAPRISHKRRSLRNEGLNLKILKQKLQEDILIPPFKTNLRKLPYASTFQDDYLKCIKDEDEDDSLHNFISQ